MEDTRQTLNVGRALVELLADKGSFTDPGDGMVDVTYVAVARIRVIHPNGKQTITHEHVWSDDVDADTHLGLVRRAQAEAERRMGL